MVFKKKNKEQVAKPKKVKKEKKPSASRGKFLILLGGFCLLASLGIFAMVLLSFIQSTSA